MAISNRQAAGAYGGRVRWDNEKARRGGRPLGAKDGAGIVRKGTAKEKQEALQAELGKAYKERVKRQVDDWRFQLNYGRQFPGGSKALLTATYKAEYYPSQEQLYAAKILLDREYPSPEPGQYQTDETGRVVLYLPHNGRGRFSTKFR